MVVYLSSDQWGVDENVPSNSDPYMSNSSSKITWFVVMSNVLHNCLVCFKHNLLNMIDNNAKHDSKDNNLPPLEFQQFDYNLLAKTKI